MVDTELRGRFKELQRLYEEHAKNQSEEDLKLKNKLRTELVDLFFVLKPYIKKQSKLQWYEPAYNYAITGDLKYIESVKEDLAYIISQLEDGA
ncbi:MAG: hypothetical protein LJE89_17950 [Deltaproteobacteria bacterium]|nr:hypothetical protein [Deltaproteobacteria bacterium]